MKLTKNSICINNGIDINKLSVLTNEFEKKDIDFKNLKICTIGRIGTQKNPRLFNDIASNFKNYKFTWIGEGSDRKLLSSSNVNVTGWLTKERVLEILNDNDIFILTSLWEGLPLSLLEAMYLRKICIVSNCIGNKDVISNGKNGFICNNLDEFITIINKLNKIELEKISKNAFDDINNVYNLKNMIDEYKKIYEKY